MPGEFFLEEDWLVVENNFQPKPDVESTGIGQKNLMKRYSLVSDVLPHFEHNGDKYYAKIPLMH